MKEEIILYSIDWGWRDGRHVPWVKEVEAIRTEKSTRIMLGGKRWRSYNPYYDCMTLDEAFKRLQEMVTSQREQAEQALADADERQKTLDEYLAKARESGRLS